MKLEDLKSLIREAFKDVEYPGDDHIAGCSRSATPMGCDECDGIAAHFKGTTWQQHTPQTLAGYESAVTLFHDEARHYYLPAFLLAELDEESGDYLPNVYDSIEFVHSPPTGTYRGEGFAKYLALLSPLQRMALVEYFKYQPDEDGIEESDDPDERVRHIINFLQT